MAVNRVTGSARRIERFCFIAVLVISPWMMAAAPSDTPVATERIVVQPKVEVAPAKAQAPSATTLDIHYGEEGLPEVVKRTRQDLMQAARTGDLEALLPILRRFPTPPEVSVTPQASPIDALKAQSGDPDGREVLAILLNILDAGWVVQNKGTAEESYIWPYYARVPLDSLAPSQIVEVLRVLTAGDFQQMREEGGYTFFQAEILADGSLKSFHIGY